MNDFLQPSHEQSLPPLRRRWSFSIWGLMQLVLAAAIAVATGKNAVIKIVRNIDSYGDTLTLSVRDPSFYEWLIGSVFSGLASALIAPVAAIMSLSLVFQATALLIVGRSCSFRSLGERCDWTFQWAGRLGLAGVMLGCVLVENVFSIEQLGLTVKDEFIWPQAAQALRAAVLIVAMMACLGWTMRVRSGLLQSRRGQWLINALFLLSVSALAMLLWMHSSLIARLVYIAVLGLESAGPLKFADQSVALLPMDRIALFYHDASLATAGTLVSAACCAVLLREWARAWRWKAPLGALLLAGWWVQAEFLHWVYWDGIRSLSSAWPEHIGLSHPHVAWTALILDGLLATLVAYRFSRQPSADPIHWALSSKDYFHESRLALVLLTIGAAGHLVPYVWQLSLDSEGCLWLALFVFCASRLRRSWRGPDGELTCNAWSLPPGRFLAKWFMVAVTFALAAPTLAWFNFIFWLGPVNWLRVFERV